MKQGKLDILQAWWDMTHADAYENPEPGIVRRLYADWLLSQLPASSRRLLRAYYWDGYTQKEIADKAMQRQRCRHGTKITRSTVSRRLEATMEILQGIIDGQ